jgi:hypothetical protein
MSAKPRVLHVINGDAMRDALVASGVGGEISVFADVLHEGPCPPDDDLAGWLATRARFIAEAGYASCDDALETATQWQSYFDRHADYEEIVLWLEHDLFDQLLLLRHLAFFARAGSTTGVRLIFTNRYLGLSSGEEMRELHDRRVAARADQFELAARLWRAFTSSDPAALRSMLDEDLTAFPYMRAALQRFLEEYPSDFNGLGRIDHQIVTLLSERARSFAELFAANAALEEAMFLGDATFHAHVVALAEARVPLVETGDVIRITQAGREVAAGGLNAVELNGIDRWFGGVHLVRTV